MSPAEKSRKLVTSEVMVDKFGRNSASAKQMRALFSKLLKSEEAVKDAYTRWISHVPDGMGGNERNVQRFFSQAIIVNAIQILCNAKMNILSDSKRIRNLNVPSDFGWVFSEIQIRIFNAPLVLEIGKFHTQSGDLFGQLHHDHFGVTERHEKGSFYTNRVLAEKMVNDAYCLGNSVLDPACGSGIFLCTVYSQIILQSQRDDQIKSNLLQFFNKVTGYDIDPLAVLMARTNLILIAYECGIEDLQPRIYLHDALTENAPEGNKEKYDLAIGNPPWIVINRIRSSSQKARIKALGNGYGVLLGGKLASTTEITAVFIYKALYDMVKSGGMIFFVCPASLLTGSQHALLRQFAGLNGVEIWTFESDAFPIHNICFKARRETGPFIRNFPVPYRTFGYQPHSAQMVEKPRTYALPSEIVYPPELEAGGLSTVNSQGRGLNSFELSPTPGLLIGRLIPTPEIFADDGEVLSYFKTILKRKEDYSLYRKKFRQGASIVPRNLLFVEKPKNADTLQNLSIESQPPVEIRPAGNIRSKKYSTWDFVLDYSSRVEPGFLFRVAKSTGLLPFKYRADDYAFLPVEKRSESEYHVGVPSQPGAAAHYRWLESVYTAHMKPGAKITSLAARINYGKALSDPRQFSELKIVYGGIGSIVKSTILRGKYIIDTSLYFYNPQSLDEAYYLIAILNSYYMTEYVKKVGSTGAGGSLRNIHKHPFDLPLPTFDPEIPLHRNFAALSREVEAYVNTTIDDLVRKAPEIRNKNKAIQNRLLQKEQYRRYLTVLSENVSELMNNKQ